MDLEDPHYKGLGEDLKELYVQELHGLQDNLEDPHYQRYQEARKDSHYQGPHGLQGDQEDPNYQGLQEDLKETHFQKLHGLQKDMKEQGQEVLDDHDVKFQPIQFQSFPGFHHYQGLHGLYGLQADQENPHYQGLQEDLKEPHFQELHGLQKDMKEKGQEVLDDHDVFQPIEFQSFPGFQYPQNKSNMEARNADFKLSSDYFGRDGRKVKVISVKSIAESISDS